MLVEGNARVGVGVTFVDQQTGWVVGTDEILHTTDGGASWVSQRGNVVGLERTPLLESVTFADQNVGIAAGWVLGEPDPTSPRPLVLVTDDAGGTWVRTTLPVDDLSIELKDVCVAPNGAALAVGFGYSGDLGLVSRDAGRSWNLIPEVGTVVHSATDVECTDGTRLWISGFGAETTNAILYSDDGGNTWLDGSASIGSSPFSWAAWGDPMSGSGAVLIRVSCSAASCVAIGIDEEDIRDRFAVVVQSADGGRTWTEGSLPPETVALRGVVVVPDR